MSLLNTLIGVLDPSVILPVNCAGALWGAFFFG